MSWDRVVEAHLKLFRQLAKPEQLQEIARKACITITAAGNSAGNREDVLRYLDAVNAVAGRVSGMSAKMKLTQKAREFGLSLM